MPKGMPQHRPTLEQRRFLRKIGWPGWGSKALTRKEANEIITEYVADRYWRAFREDFQVWFADEGWRE